jgi:Raf kinase inhibitor-like YbhB/YbcL family protein
MTRSSAISFALLIVGSIQAQTFSLRSGNLGGQATEQQVFNGFGCSGSNESPQLSWENAPEGTQSFAITMYDPDAPTGSGFWHWVVFDVPAATRSLAAGAGAVEKDLMPPGTIQSLTDFGARGYGGPCPPPGHGQHRYIITLHALKTAKLGLAPETNPALVGFNLNAQTLAKASIIFYYGR